MISKVSNGEMKIDPMTNDYELIKGPGTSTSDSIIKDVKAREGILQPELFPNPIQGVLKDAMAHVDSVNLKYKHSDELDLRLGTGSIARTTRLRNEENKQKEAGESLSIVNYAINAQPYVRAAKEGKDIPGYAGGKITGTDSRAYKRRQGILGAEELLLDLDALTIPNVYKEPEVPVVQDPPTRSSSWGGLGNTIASGLGMVAGLSQYLGARGQKLTSPTTYAPNLYERQALTTLANRSASVYPQLQAMRDTEARNRWAIRNSGGLTGAQKYLANVASGIGLQRNYASVIDAANQLNNQYKGEWANAALGIGTQNAQRMQNSNQYRDEAYARAHGARTQMEQMGIFNMLNQIQSYYANEFKRHQFERTMRLYDQEYDRRVKS